MLEAFWLIHLAIAQAVLIALGIATVWGLAKLWQMAIWFEED
jgi:hypothetical protein